MVQDTNIDVLAHIETLGNKIKQAKNVADLYFIACNSSKLLINLHQALFWQMSFMGPKIKAVSGTANLDNNAPMLRFMKRLVTAQLHQQKKPEMV